MDYQQIGRQIRAARLRRKMTQAQLAEAADLSVPYISHVERGKKRVSLDALLRISQAVDVTVDQLLSGTQPQDTVMPSSGLSRNWRGCRRKNGMNSVWPGPSR